MEGIQCGFDMVSHWTNDLFVGSFMTLEGTRSDKGQISWSTWLDGRGGALCFDTHDYSRLNSHGKPMIRLLVSTSHCKSERLSEIS